MTVSLRDESEIRFLFYTYDPAGRDCVIPIYACCEDTAYRKFRRMYGADTIVDQILVDSKER